MQKGNQKTTITNGRQKNEIKQAKEKEKKMNTIKKKTKII